MSPDTHEMPTKVFITGAVGFIGRSLAGYSIDKARRQLGYEPRVSLEDGMEPTKLWAVAEGLVANL
jgi:nucleoside-diphosphate-sugar epimerase